MTLRAFYATHDLAGHPKNSVIVVDDQDPYGMGLAHSGYFAEIVDPEPEETDRAAEGSPGA